MITNLLNEALRGKVVRAGESVQCGWLWLTVLDPGPPISFQSLDFKAMASFTTDLARAEQIIQAQHAAVVESDSEEEGCTLRHTALVSKSFVPGEDDAFIERQQKADGQDSGWYVGVADDPLDLNDSDSFHLMSLYELSIKDARMVRYWLLPVGTTIFLADAPSTPPENYRSL